MYTKAVLVFWIAACIASATASCHADNCLRALRRFESSAIPFCQTYIHAPQVTVTVPGGNHPSTIVSLQNPTTSQKPVASSSLPPFVAQFPASRISSACSCLSIPPLTKTVTISSSTEQSSATLSTKSSVTTTKTPSPSCSPIFRLVGASESIFNPKNTPFTIKLPCPVLDKSNYTIFANLNPVTTSNSTADAIILPGFSEDYVFLTIAALDISGVPIFQSFQLLFGSINMPVLVLGENGQPAANIQVEANATIYPGIGQIGKTDASGLFIVTNLPETTIGLKAKGGNNEIGVNGVAATTTTVTLRLTPLNPPNDFSNLDFSNGTAGWSNGKIIPHTEKRAVDNDLVLSTNAQFDLQTTSSTWKTFPFSKTAFIRYRFITAEVPGGYFGTQYNDYFSITIRADTGASATVFHSMNELGIGAFDSSGATQWSTLQLSIPKAKGVQFDVAVSNVADNLLDSEVVIDKAGDLTCDECGDCSKCPGDPMCQDVCKSPPLQSCTFYSACASAEVPDCLANEEYALSYGEKNCLKFQTNLKRFSAAGQAFIWATMHCLQQALIPALNCDATCKSVRAAAFASHPPCYVGAGFCTLEPMDYFWLLATIYQDLFSLESGQQVLDTIKLKGCGKTIALNIGKEIENLVGEAANAVEAVLNQAKAAALRVAKKFFDDL